MKKVSAMDKLPDSTMYKGMTAHQLAELYDDVISIPHFYALLQKNREVAASMKEKLNPIHDVAYGDEPLQKLDIYAIKNANKLPVLIDIHGGGWVAGSKNARSVPAEAIISQGVMWVPIDYGLAPAYPIEDIINHVRAALSWVYHHISEYGGDPSQIYVSGQSAGAHLAATALMPDWHKTFDVPKECIKGLIALSGIYDFGSLIESDQTELKEQLKLTTLDESKRFSPYYQLPNSSLPVIISYGDKEPFGYMQEATDYAKALENVGCDVSLMIVPNANHFDMINEIGNREGLLFKKVMQMIFKHNE